MERRTGHKLLPLILLVLGGFSGAAGAQALNKESYGEYLDALVNVDAEALKNRFYHEDFSIRIGEETMDVARLLEFENDLKSLVDAHFEVNQIVADESGIAVDAVETFNVKQDGDVPNVGPARAGEQYDLHLNVFYVLSGGKILTIKANVLSVEKIR